jgi:hypothetical protein
MTTAPKETYLGDGLYVSHDGYTIRLRAADAYGGQQIVYLEPSVLRAFERYVTELKERPEALI